MDQKTWIWFSLHFKSVHWRRTILLSCTITLQAADNLWQRECYCIIIIYMHGRKSTSSPTVINKRKHNADPGNNFWALQFAVPMWLPKDKYINRNGSYLLEIFGVWLLEQFANPFMVFQKPLCF